MTLIYNERTGKTFDIDDVSQIDIVTREGIPVERYNVRHDTRSLLSLAQAGLFSDYEYMPVTTKDIAQKTALGMEVRSGTYGIIRTAAGVAGGVLGGVKGAGLAYTLTNLGLEAFEYGANYLKKDKPKEFWNEFVNNVNEIKDEDSGFMRFLEGYGMSQTYFSKGASEALYQEWGDVLKTSGSYTAGNIIGALVKGTAAVAAFGGMSEGASWANVSNGLVADLSLTDGLSEMGSRIGNGMEVYESLKAGFTVGLISGATGAVTMKALPYMFRNLAPEITKIYHGSSMFHAMSNAAETAAWYSISQTASGMALGEDRPIDLATMGIMFGAAFGLSFLGHKLSSRHIKEEAVEKVLGVPKEQMDEGFKQAYYIYDNTAVEKSKEESLWIARQWNAMDRATNTQYVSEAELKNAVNARHLSDKNYNLSEDTLNTIAGEVKNRSPYAGTAWGAVEREGGAVTVGKLQRELSDAALEVLNESTDRLLKLGISPDKVSSIRNKVVEKAGGLTKGRIGNFEIRHAFEEIMGGGMII